MQQKDIAIIGMACRVPAANNYNEFWQNLSNGVNAIKEIPPERWDIQTYYSSNSNEPNKSVSKWCGLVENIEQFDNQFFNITPNEANAMDPQQRLLLEETWHCIEDSGLSLEMLQDRVTSVFIGFMATDYRQFLCLPENRANSYSCLGNYTALLANRISYAFGLRGPSIASDAACAASLVALHQAKQSLLTDESDYALAGGVSLNLHPWKYISFSKARMLSPDGQCKTFDKDANGYVPGDGVGVLLLQRLEDALRDGNHVYGLLKGTAINHSGTPLSITAPRVEAQRDVILAAYRDAGFSPETVTYVEAHGTGTSLGDPIEVEGLTKAFQEYTSNRQFCKIGSVKTNIGHLEAAAGVAGVIKVLLMMRHRMIPKTLNVRIVNPIIHFHETPFEVALQPTEWQSVKDWLPLRASVSAFGFGGVNGHVLLESFEQPLKTTEETEIAQESDMLFILSANSPKSLTSMQDRWKTFVESNTYANSSLYDICATLKTRRATFPYRFGFHVETKQKLQALVSQEIPLPTRQKPRSWYLRIGKGTSGSYAQILPLIMENRVFHHQLNLVHKCFANLTSTHPLTPPHNGESFGPVDAFMVDYAYLSTIFALGFTPSLITYEGTGVLPALVLSGIISLQDALRVLTDRKAVEQLTFARPRIPVYDHVTGQVLKRYHFDDQYLRLLMDELLSATGIPAKVLFGGGKPEDLVQIKQENTRLGALLIRAHVITLDCLQQSLDEQASTRKLLGEILVEKGCCSQKQIKDALHQQDILRKYVDEIIFNYVDKARLLSEGQYTFKKFLGEWDQILSRVGENFLHMLYDNEMLSAEDEKLERKKLLFMIIIMTSLYKLDKKWNLREDSLSGEHRFHEMLDLVVEDVIPKEALIEMFLKDTPDYSQIADTLNARQHLMNPQSPYTYITQHSRDLWEIQNIAAWIAQAAAARPTVPDMSEMDVLEYGNFTGRAPQTEHVVSIEITGNVTKTFKESLLKLWLRGVDFRWDKLYPEGTFKKVALPGYAFDRKPFWVK